MSDIGIALHGAFELIARAMALGTMHHCFLKSDYICIVLQILVDCSGDDNEEKNPETAFLNKKSALVKIVEESPVCKTIIFCNKVAPVPNMFMDGSIMVWLITTSLLCFSIARLIHAERLRMC